MPNVSDTAPTIADQLVAVGRRFHARGWVLGTSGNFSAVVSHDPLRLAITASSLDKGALDPSHILHVGEDCVVVSGAGRPSAETLLHVEIVRHRGACAVLHTHSVWGTTLSDAHASAGGLGIDGYEMLKGLDGVRTHEHREWVPIVENDQDMARLSGVLREVLTRHPAAHAVLLRRHGLYTWGKSLAEAVRHVEILEFLFETIGRTASYTQFSGREGYHGIAQSS
jgi:methylthioribulose-1-phosphate dehydratase